VYILQRLELKREPHVSELEEAVEKEVGILEARNAARKQRRATVVDDSDNDIENTMSEGRWEAVQEFMNKWGPKLEKWDGIIDRIEFEEVVVDAPADIEVNASKRGKNDKVLLKEAELDEEVQKEKRGKMSAQGGSTGGGSSSSEGGERETSDGEGGEVDLADSDEENDSDDENEPLGVVECDYKCSTKQVAHNIESQNKNGELEKSSEVQKKVGSGSGSISEGKGLSKKVLAHD
jgi:hypothetical protein